MAHRGEVKLSARIFMTFSDLLSPRLPMDGEPRWNGEESAAFDLYLQSEREIPASLLMENAGQATARLALDLLEPESPSPGASILIVAGPGNNGGDALVAARGMLQASPFPIEVWAPLGLPAAADSPAGQAREAARALGIPIHSSAEPSTGLSSAGLILDGLFGVGLARPLEGVSHAAIEAIDAAPAPIFALDLPSGLHADTGEILGIAPRALATLSYIGPKQGLEQGAGPELAGTIYTTSIGVAPAVAQDWLAQRRSRA